VIRRASSCLVCLIPTGITNSKERRIGREPPCSFSNLADLLSEIKRRILQRPQPGPH
jgi:hypothetical protein